MPDRKISNRAASIRARLLILAKSKGVPFDLILTRYALERFLYRLSLSAMDRDRFILKGAILLTARLPDEHRPTRDVDMLGFGDPNPDSLRDFFQRVSRISCDDGVEYHAAETRIIREDNEYGGVRLTSRATLAGARVAVVIDIGFGDATVPEPDMIPLPTLLPDLPGAVLKGYALETVIAEKFQAIVALGLSNSRLKDYYDIWVIKNYSGIDFHANDRLPRAMRATFDRRRSVALPATLPDGLTSQFAASPNHRRQWQAFLLGATYRPDSLPAMVAELADFLMPFALKARSYQDRTGPVSTWTKPSRR